MRPVNSSAGSRIRRSTEGRTSSLTSHGKRFSMITNNQNPEDFLSDDDLDMEMHEGRHSSYSSDQRSTEPEMMGSSKYPQRKRKRNRLIFNDEEIPFGRKGGKGMILGSNSNYSPLKIPSVPVIEKGLEKKIAQRLGWSLRTLLKLPKAHRWVCYEWFYANIDQPLFLGENDFELCLRESFPQLKTRLLKKVEWNKIRRLMGKPRRCSPSFFAEERAALNLKRNKIRLLQQQKAVDISQYKDLPPNIPLSLVIGARVTALLRHPSDGLFTGTIAATDAVTGQYRITFDRPGLGSHPVPDYEVLSIDPPEFMPLSSFQTKIRPRIPLPSKFFEELGSQVHQAITGPGGDTLAVKSNNDNKVDQLRSSSSQLMTSNSHSTQASASDGTLGGFPIKFLVSLVRLSKILAVKKRKIYELKSMNLEAERLRSLHEAIPHEFQKHYANTILDLERLNFDLNELLKNVQFFASDLIPDPLTAPQNNPETMKKLLFEEAKEFTERSLLLCNVKNEKTMDTIAQLLSIMLHLRNFSDTEVGSFELKNLQDALSDTKKYLDPENGELFQSQVEIHVNHIQSSFSHLGNLGAFAESVSVDPRTG